MQTISEIRETVRGWMTAEYSAEEIAEARHNTAVNTYNRIDASLPVSAANGLGANYTVRHGAFRIRPFIARFTGEVLYYEVTGPEVTKLAYTLDGALLVARQMGAPHTHIAPIWTATAAGIPESVESLLAEFDDVPEFDPDEDLGEEPA